MDREKRKITTTCYHCKKNFTQEELRYPWADDPVVFLCQPCFVKKYQDFKETGGETHSFSDIDELMEELEKE